MGVKTIITDDLTGDDLPDGTEPTVVAVDGDEYKPYLGKESLETLVAALSGEAVLLQPYHDAQASKKTLKAQYDTLEESFDDLRKAADALLSAYKGEDAPEAVKEFEKAYEAIGSTPRTAAKESTTQAAPRTTRKSSLNNYGLDYKTVKAWAIEKGLTSANGKPITENTVRLSQAVYDQYKEENA